MNKKGFTLLELLIGITLISIIMAFLFRLVSDIQNEGFSNTYIVTNQTNRNEIISLTNSISVKNGNLCKFVLNRGSLESTLTYTFCNNKVMTITVKKKEVTINYDSTNHRYVMKDDNAYYEVTPKINHVTYSGTKMLIVDIITNKKGLVATTIDDVEIMAIGNYSFSQVVDNVADFIYEGMVNSYRVTENGTYKLEAWGAQGGSVSGYTGGYGAYVVGYADLNAGDELYIYVGGQGGSDCVTTDCEAGYNGGGAGKRYVGDNNNHVAGGGGATSIALVDDMIPEISDASDIYIVAGGGAGAYYHGSGSDYSSNGGSGGGAAGQDGATVGYTSNFGAGGTQLAGGTAGFRGGAGSYGQGGTGDPGSSGGGGGYYGGGASAHAGAGGGSGYINTSLLSNAEMYCYGCTESDEPETKTILTTCINELPTDNCAKTGDGRVRITKM